MRELTDQQYFTLLRTILNTVKAVGFTPYYYDSTTIGDKYTESNCGLCNDNFTTKETAMWPDEFPQRKSMMYRKRWQVCPFDKRKAGESHCNGCFYTCRLFQGKRPLTQKGAILRVERHIQRVEDDLGCSLWEAIKNNLSLSQEWRDARKC